MYIQLELNAVIPNSHAKSSFRHGSKRDPMQRNEGTGSGGWSYGFPCFVGFCLADREPEFLEGGTHDE